MLKTGRHAVGERIAGGEQFHFATVLLARRYYATGKLRTSALLARRHGGARAGAS